MLLASVETMRKAFGYSLNPDVQAALTEVLHGVEPYLASILNMSTFARQTTTDTFFVAAPQKTNGGGFVKTEFRLSHGMVVSIGGVKAATSFEGLSDSGALDLASTMVSSPADKEKGILRNLSTNFNNQLVQVTYTHGFLPMSAPNENAYADVPEWLQIAARFQAAIAFENHPSAEEAGVKQDTKELKRQFAVMIANHRRYAPTALMPL